MDEENAIAILEPQESLEKDDFDAAVKVIDPFIEEHGKLNGVIISTKSFPGWEDFTALSRHFTFIKNHHKKVKRLAFVTDSFVGSIAENITGHFVEAEVKTFPFGEMEKAKEWILEKA
jgi:hypothetical protein